MDFMKWLNSLDELLYEVMSWLLFFPLTLGRAIFRPLATMRTVAVQMGLPDDEQFDDLLSPPLFLTLGLLLAHGVAVALGKTDAIVVSRHGLASLIDNPSSALALRVIVFASFPLFLAARSLRRAGIPLGRLSLRQPFYEQCFPGAVLSLGVSVGASLVTVPLPWCRPIGVALILGSLLHFLVVNTRWFAMTGNTGLGRAAASVTLGLLQGALFLFVVGFVFTR